MGLRINTNVASLNAALNLGRANALLSKSLTRLSTGLKINTAADGPADLIVSEKMRSQIRAISQATENSQIAINMLSTAEGALNEVNSLLIKVKGLALKAAQTGTNSPDEIAASQAEVDAALQSINSIARNTSFGSKFLLDGSLDIAVSEVNTSEVNVQIERANFMGGSKRLTMEVEKAAERAFSSFDLNSDGNLAASQTIKVTGNRGSSTITFAAGAAGEDIAKEINDQTS
ncbi:MAG: flagellin, partial [Planctomycetes bacterium]|nr:flagellin [Planctomycetota bacterium]